MSLVSPVHDLSLKATNSRRVIASRASGCSTRKTALPACWSPSAGMSLPMPSLLTGRQHQRYGVASTTRHDSSIVSLLTPKKPRLEPSIGLGNNDLRATTGAEAPDGGRYYDAS